MRLKGIVEAFSSILSWSGGREIGLGREGKGDLFVITKIDSAVLT